MAWQTIRGNQIRFHRAGPDRPLRRAQEWTQSMQGGEKVHRAVTPAYDVSSTVISGRTEITVFGDEPYSSNALTLSVQFQESFSAAAREVTLSVCPPLSDY